MLRIFLISTTSCTPITDFFLAEEKKLSLQAENLKKMFSAVSFKKNLPEEQLVEAPKTRKLSFDEIPYPNSTQQFPIAFQNLLFGFAESRNIDTDGLRGRSMHMLVTGLQDWSPMTIDFILDTNETGDIDLDAEEALSDFFDVLEIANPGDAKVRRTEATIFSISSRHPRELYELVMGFLEEEECDTLDSSLTWDEVRSPKDQPELKIILANTWERNAYRIAQIDRLKIIERNEEEDLAKENDPSLVEAIETCILDFMPAQNFHFGAVSPEALDYAIKLDMGNDFPKGHELRFCH